MFRPFCVALTFVAVCVGWVFFRAQTFGDAGAILQRMALPIAGAGMGAAGTVGVLSILGLLLAGHLIGTWTNVKKWQQRVPAPLLGASLAVVLLLILILTPEDGRAFIYFQF